jgi:short-subunit dehydrogenase
VLINNAAYGLHVPVEEASSEQIRDQFETNVFGLIRLTQLVLPGMRRARRGRVVNISSMAGRFSPPGGGFYHATKHAVEAVSDSLRLEVKPYGIDVVVQPGPTITGFSGTAVATMASGTADRPYTSFRAELADMYRNRSFRSRNGAVPAERAAAVIVKAATVPRPRPRYAVGAVARLTITAKRLLPDRAFDAIVRSQFPTPRTPAATR